MKRRRAKWVLTRVRTDPRPNWHDSRSMHGMQCHYPTRGQWWAWLAYIKRTKKARRFR